MSNRFLTEQFAKWRENSRNLVLATVTETDGSTYSKAGRQLLINEQGRYAGLVGGGCLEGDLVLRAREVLDGGAPQLVSYDMRDDADDLWGMGLGCRGVMQLLLQPLTSSENWRPFGEIAAAMSDKRAVTASLVIASNHADHPVGTLQLRTAAAANLPNSVTTETPQGNYTALHWLINPWPRLLVLGAGPDAEPVVNIARALGWEVCVADHRAELLDAAGFAPADQRVVLDGRDISEQLPLDSFSAACVMSHHLQTDQRYLQSLSNCTLAYTGVLGPAARRAKILTNLQLQDSAFAARLHGPVGLDIGADTPQSIALALIAEIQATLATGQRSSRALSPS